MKVTDDHNYCTVSEIDKSELNILTNLLRIEDAGRFYSQAYKNKYWDGYHYFFNKKTNKFPAGLLHIVRKRFPYATYTLAGQPQKLNEYKTLKNLTPRPDQIELITTALDARRGIIQAPTSYGKSACIAMLCKAIPGNVLVITHTKTLLYQTAADLKRETGEEIGLIGDGRASTERITIGLIKSLTDLQLEAMNGIIVDECHRCSADMLFNFILSLPAQYRYGLSADPLDDQDVKANSLFKRFRILACFGPIVSKFGIEQAKEAGIIAKPNIHMMRVKDPHGGKYTEATYQEAYDALVVYNELLHSTVAGICNDNKSDQIMILLRRVDHGKILEAMIPNSRFLYGELPSDTVNRGIEDFKSGKYSVLIGSDIFKEGVNIPEVDTLINAGSDVADTKQRLGRGLRRRVGKETVEVYDFLICGNSHIEKHSKERLRIYLADGHPVNGTVSPMRSI
jgi:superfamily II DNA or RNA helicase